MRLAVCTLAVTVSLAAALAPQRAHAWTQETHRRIVLDALEYMRQNPGTTQYSKLAAWAQRGNVTWAALAQAMGQSAYDVDDFADTYICGAITGDCEIAPLWSLAATITRYTSFWHFQNHTRGVDRHGNPFGGYDYSRLTQEGDIDTLAASWLWNDYLDDGSGGLRGILGDSAKYNSYGLTEAHYRLGGYSTASMYADYQTFPFQPIDNLAQYWWRQFVAQPSPQTIGYVLHSTDLVQPHHTWTTLAKNHSGWESWVRDYYDTEHLSDFALVTAALGDGTLGAPCASAAVSDLRTLLTQGGTYSYANGGSVLSTTDHAERARVARKMIPHAIAMSVRVLDCAAQRVAQ